MHLRKRLITTVFITTVMALLIAGSAAADPPVQDPTSATGIALASSVASKISYQGRLTDAAGNPLNGNYNLVFQLWDDATAGSQVGSDIVRNNVPVSNGLFTVELDVPQEAFNGQALWLRIQVNGQWLAPRQELLPVPYALSLRPGAQIRGDIGTAPAVVVVNGGSGGTAVQAHGDGVGLDAQGQTGVHAVGWAMGVDATGMTGVRGQGDVGVRGEGLTGVHGESDIGYGVVGVTNAPITATAAAGVYGESMNVHGVEGFSQFGVGVFGHSEGGFGAGVGGSGATGVYGTGGLVGVSGYTESDDGTGVAGTATGYNSRGVEGAAQFGTGVLGSGETGVKGTSTVGVGVQGEGSTGVEGRSQSGVGVYGNTGSGVAAVMGEGPKGVLGISSADSGEGVHGNGTGSNTEGVLGTSVNAHGVAGYSNGSNGSLAIGVYGQTTASWGLATNQHLWVGGNCTGCTVAFLARNDGAKPLEVGDVVSIAGIAPPLKGQQTPVLKVQRATNADKGFLGVVQARATVDEMPLYNADATQAQAIEMPGMASGEAAPDEYLFVVVQGLARVRADASAGAIQVGDPVGPVGAAGLASRLSQDAPFALAVGRALEPLDRGTGLIWVFVAGR